MLAIIVGAKGVIDLALCSLGLSGQDEVLLVMFLLLALFYYFLEASLLCFTPLFLYYFSLNILITREMNIKTFTSMYFFKISCTITSWSPFFSLRNHSKNISFLLIFLDLCGMWGYSWFGGSSPDNVSSMWGMCLLVTIC